jgi:hypothetical protein
MQTDIKNKKQKEMETNLEAEDDEAIWLISALLWFIFILESIRFVIDNGFPYCMCLRQNYKAYYSNIIR